MSEFQSQRTDVPPRGDPLLRSALVVINIVLFLLAACIILLLLILPVLLFTQDRTVEAGGLTVKLISMTGPTTILPLAIVIIGLAFQFMRELRRIVVSVGAGDPFIAVNADRLRNMAWLVLAIQALELLMGVLAYWIERRPEGLAAEATVSGMSGLLIALVLFILARVFRVGAEMRAELEGTV